METPSIYWPLAFLLLCLTMSIAASRKGLPGTIVFFVTIASSVALMFLMSYLYPWYWEGKAAAMGVAAFFLPAAGQICFLLVEPKRKPEKISAAIRNQVGVWLMIAAALIVLSSLTVRTGSNLELISYAAATQNLGMFLGIAGVLFFVFGRKKAGSEAGASSQSGAVPQTKKCPYCAEDVLAAAIKCRHCGSDLLAASKS